MNAPMPRSEKAKPAAKRYVAATNPNTSQVLVRLPPALLAQLDAVMEELNANVGESPLWTRSDVVRAILAKRLRDRKPGELP